MEEGFGVDKARNDLRYNHYAYLRSLQQPFGCYRPLRHP